MPPSRLFLIDAHALCYRAYYAIKDLTTSKGQATNAVYGFISTLKKILQQYKPDYLAVCFDVKGKTLRQEKFAEYKIQRPAMPDDLISQIPLIKEVVAAYKLTICECEGYEADDVIATLAKKIPAKNVEIVIVSDDKDMMQLVNEKVKVFSIRKDQMLGHDEVKATLGVEPAYIVDYIGLAGDSTDNIPGVKGIGQVSAKNLINQYGRIEQILAKADQLKPALGEKLTEQKDMALLSRELAELATDVPITVKLNDLKVQPADAQKLFALFNDLEFRRFAEEVSPQVQDTPRLKVTELKAKEALQDLDAKIRKAGQLAFLIEGEEGETLFEGQLCISMGSQEGYRLSLNKLKALKSFQDKTVVKVTYDYKEMIKVFARYGCPIDGPVFDVMLAGYLLSPSRSAYDVKPLAWDYLKMTIPDQDKTLRETGAAYQLYGPLKKALEACDCLKLLEEIEIPLSRVLARMETEGVKLDEKLLKQLSQECTKKIDGLMKDLFEMAGEEFNLNSPKQLSHILFEKLKLPVIKKTKTGFSTNEAVLIRLAQQHPLPGLILDYRQLAKLKSTYIDALPKLVDPETGRIHTSFNQPGTETGRLSSNNPNLQNIPIRTDMGRRIRKAFIPSQKGSVLISADYSQIELRILAHLSKDQSLKEAFSRDEDIHTFTAAQIFEVAESDVTPDMRNSAKRVNFGIIYGMSAFGLAKDLDIPQPEAQDFIDRYFLRYPGVKKFMDKTVKDCEKKGYVVTLLNRHRYLPEINSSNMAVRQFAQRQAINTPVQGSAADLMKLAMIQVQEALDQVQLSAKMIITVHDELVFDVPDGEVEQLAQLIHQHMEHALELTVPVKVTVKQGKNWLDMEEI